MLRCYMSFPTCISLYSMTHGQKNSLKHQKLDSENLSLKISAQTFSIGNDRPMLVCTALENTEMWEELVKQNRQKDQAQARSETCEVLCFSSICLTWFLLLSFYYFYVTHNIFFFIRHAFFLRVKSLTPKAFIHIPISVVS